MELATTTVVRPLTTMVLLPPGATATKAKPPEPAADEPHGLDFVVEIPLLVVVFEDEQDCNTLTLPLTSRAWL